ncbi:6-phosphofructokinase [Lignipirellula cremea]|uniref:6-phosphofructokinase 1 n=1 Tax=Lignipirellula cremea TaxID=2528010 RepID=A0A518DNE2_9BACT|nr:6-phosphofructokinase [Lignipirellula cremea]QDU93356.1 6-phosphofructokinase 1 [Lignipirellula cremea]
MTTLARPPKSQHSFRRAAILFAGGPAPAANAVISTAAVSFVRADIEVLGIKHGYSSLASYSPDAPLEEGRDYMIIDHDALKRSRNSQGIIIGTARTNPGKHVSSPEHLDDAERSEPLRRVYEGLMSLGVDCLVSIGGDDTLKTANKFKMFQDRMPADKKRIPIVHLPKTIDNDYSGIDFTFGYFTAVETLATEIRNLLYDAEAGRAYFLAETMGRSAGWLAYGAAIAGEASLVVSVEDINGEYASEEIVVDSEGNEKTTTIMNVDKVVDRIVRTMLARDKEGKPFGVIVLAEGLAEFLPQSYLEGIPRDEHGHIAISQVNLGRLFAKLVSKLYGERSGQARKVTGLQLGYESRCARPLGFDVMLGSQLGVGAYRALVEERLNGVMVSVSGQLDLHYVPFDQLVDKETLITKVRFINTQSDFYRLARFLETYVE